MRGDWIRVLLLPLLLAAGLGACASNAVQPGIVYTSSAQPSGGGTYGSGPYNGPAPSGPVATSPAQGNNSGGAIGGSGRVVSIREVGLQGAGGGGGGGGGNGALMGGLLGAGTGATIGAITSQTLGGGIVGALLGAVGGAIAGTIVSGPSGPNVYGGRGIEVTVQRDDGQKVTVAQRDDGDVQLGDRVQIVQNQRGVTQVVRDTSRNPD